MQDKKTIARRARVKLNFDLKHGPGSADRLIEMAHQAKTVETMGSHFGLSGARIGVILETLLGMPYSQYLATHGVERQGVERSTNGG